MQMTDIGHQSGVSFLLTGFARLIHSKPSAKQDDAKGAAHCITNPSSGPAAGKVSAFTMLRAVGEPARSLVLEDPKQNLPIRLFTKAAVKHVELSYQEVSRDLLRLTAYLCC